MNSVLAKLLALCLAAWLTASERAAAQFAPSSPAAQVPPAQIPETWLMLKNGSTFSARMLSAGERVRLRVNEGDIEVRASEIALTGYSLTDLAEQQWAALHQQQLDKQLPFIDWCTRHNLYDIADAALAQIAPKTQDPPRVEAYQARVRRLREIHQEQLAFQAAPPVASAPLTANPVTAAVAAPPKSPPMAATPTSTAATATLLLPAQPLAPQATPAPTVPTPAAGPSSVQQAAYQPLDIPREKTSAAKEAAINSPHPATLPSAAVELFTARVQPWVVSRCSGCHDSQSPHSFKLERYSKQEGVTRATTLKNLAAVTRLVDKDNPAESPLLVMAARAHGTSLMPPITAGDAAAMAAFREFVGLATGRELPKPAKPSAHSTTTPTDLMGHVTPGRATFPASAVEETATEDKAAEVLKQTGPGWQAAIERQKAIDAEAQKLRDLQNTSQQVNAARGLISDPAVKPAATTTAAPSAPLAVPATSLLLPPTATATSTPAVAIDDQPELLRKLPSSALLFDNAAAKASIAEAANGPAPQPTSPPNVSAPVATPPSSLQLNTLPPSAMPESLLPPSLAAKPKVDLELESALETPTATPAAAALKGQDGLTLENAAPAKPAPAINLKRPRRMFPLPPEDSPAPSKGVGTGDIKRR